MSEHNIFILVQIV